MRCHHSIDPRPAARPPPMSVKSVNLPAGLSRFSTPRLYRLGALQTSTAFCGDISPPEATGEQLTVAI